jgi:hypothetical protein
VGEIVRIRFEEKEGKPRGVFFLFGTGQVKVAEGWDEEGESLRITRSRKSCLIVEFL